MIPFSWLVPKLVLASMPDIVKDMSEPYFVRIRIKHGMAVQKLAEKAPSRALNLRNQNQWSIEMYRIFGDERFYIVKTGARVSSRLSGYTTKIVVAKPIGYKRRPTPNRTRHPDRGAERGGGIARYLY